MASRKGAFALGAMQAVISADDREGSVLSDLPADGARDARRPRLGRLALCVMCGLVALMLWPLSALAWKPIDHLYAANQAIAPILGGQNAVTILGQNYPVPTQVATSIRNHPNDYRGGVVGPDAFPDIVAGQGSIHPDNRTDNGTKPVDWTPGHSYAYEWLALVFRAGWDAYNKCGGCADGQRDLAFTYGFLTHAGEDMWGHTFVNGFAKGVFPSVTEVTDPAKLRIAIRHIVVEGYVGVHTPNTNLTINAPTDFIYNTFINNPAAAALGRGAIIDNFMKLRAALQAEANDETDYIEHGTLRGCGWPVNWPSCAVRGYLNEWIIDIDTGLKAYPDLSLKIARDLFGQRQANLTALGTDITDYVNHYLLEMLGAPGFAAKIAQLSTAARRWISAVAEPIIAPLEALVHEFANTVFEAATGLTLDQWTDYLKSPQTWINSATLGFAANTSQTLDQLIGLQYDGTKNAPGTSAPEFFNPSKFAAMNDTTNMASLILLNGSGLTSVLKAQNDPTAYYLTDTTAYPQNIMVQVVSTAAGPNTTGWIKSLDGDHQWMATSSRDGLSYGTGGMYLWKNCAARPVFRALFTGWNDGTNNSTGFPDSQDPLPCAQTVAPPTPPTLVAPPAITAYGEAQSCQTRPDYCGPGSLFISEGTWTGGESTTYTYEWAICGQGCGIRAGSGCFFHHPSGPVHTLTKEDSDATLFGVVQATNEYGCEQAVVGYKVPRLDLVPPTIKITKVTPIANTQSALVSFTLSEASYMSVYLSEKAATQVPCEKFFPNDPSKKGKMCDDWVQRPDPGQPQWAASAGQTSFPFRTDYYGALTPGRYEVSIRPKDLVGNWGDYDTFEFTVP